MYSDNPRSRIGREFLWIYKETANYIAKLTHTQPSKIKSGKVLLFMSVITLREDGVTEFSATDIANNTGMPRTSIMRYCKWFVEKEVFEEDFGKFRCIGRTPQFLLNPNELYSRPLDTVKEIDYARKEQLKMAVREIIEELDPNFTKPEHRETTGEITTFKNGAKILTPADIKTSDTPRGASADVTMFIDDDEADFDDDVE